MNFNYFILFSSFIVIFCSVVYLLAYRERRKIVRSGNIEYPGMSIVVPVWNEEFTIADTLDSLLNMKNCYHGRMEIIVIDDHSTDNSYSLIEEYARKHKEIRCFKKDAHHSRGKSESLNQGFAVAKYELVGCVDADSYPDPQSLNYIAEEFQDPQVGAVTTKLVVKKPQRIVEWFQQIEYMYSNFVIMAFDAIDSVYITRGPLSIYRKDVMDKIGGFAAAGVTPTEDMEITFRIRKAGYSIRGSKNAKVYTSVMPTWKKLYWQRMRWNRGTLINFYLHRDIFLNSKYGMLSMFILPTASIMIAMVAFIITYFLYNIITFIINKSISIYWIVTSGYYPDFSQVKEGFFSGDYSFAFHNIMLLASVMLIYLIVNGLGFKESKERFSFKYLFFMLATPLIYNPVMIYFWASAMVMQTTKNGVRWR